VYNKRKTTCRIESARDTKRKSQEIQLKVCNIIERIKLCASSMIREGWWESEERTVGLGAGGRETMLEAET
jgi:hypothetical protein